jgi:DNA-binding MarR family transcriptional regulator
MTTHPNGDQDPGQQDGLLEKVTADPSLTDGVADASERYPVSFAIFGLARAHRSIAARMLRELGLHLGQEIMLMQLNTAGGSSEVNLARTFGVEPATIAKSVRRMEQAGLVTRSKSTKDRRVTLVHLTEAGRALTVEVEKVWAELERVTVAERSDEEQRDFVRLARQLASTVTQHENEM